MLAACVWLIYVCDRIADALRLPSPLLTRERHWFHGRHKWKLALSGGAVFALALNWSLHNFDTVVLRSGLGLTSMVVVYLVLVQLGWLKPVWKEAVVGVLFAAGTSLPVWTRGAGADAELVLGTGCFAVLCWINCVAIEYWETHRSTTSAGEESRLLQLVGRRLPIAAAILGVASLAVWSAIPRHGFGEIFGACVLSCAALAALDGYRNSFSTARLRILADVALLTPLLFLRGFPR